MAEHPIQGLMSTAMENIKQMVDVNTVIGDPVETPDGSVIIPISRVGFGFAAGGSEFEGTGHEKGKVSGSTNGIEKSHSANDLPFGGGAGGGVSISPMGFLVVGHGQIKLLSTEGNSQIVERLVDLVPTVMDKVQSMSKKSPKESESNHDQMKMHTTGQLQQ